MGSLQVTHLSWCRSYINVSGEMSSQVVKALSEMGRKSRDPQTNGAGDIQLTPFLLKGELMEDPSYGPPTNVIV